MRKVIITFLGDRGAVETRYSFQGREYVGGVFPQALRDFCEYDQMLVCVTPKAREKTWPVLESLHDPRIEAVDIPTGETTEEMWKTFRTIAEKVGEGDEVTFDITHGLRSLPFLVFLFAAYLKTAKSVNIRAVYYGALELQNKELGKPAPVINLSEFVSMLDWITATDRFIDLGLGNRLSELICGTLPEVARAIDDTSLALQLSRPLGTMEAAGKLRREIEEVKQKEVVLPPPFDLLSDKVRDAYTGFALADPRSDANTVENLRRQVKMVGWYVDRYQYVQAATLWREALVSLVAYACGFKAEEIFNKNKRKKVEDALNKPATKEDANSQQSATPSEVLTTLRSHEQYPRIVGLWSKFKDVRNDIAHAEMTDASKSASELVSSVKKMREDLQSLVECILPSPATSVDLETP